MTNDGKKWKPDDAESLKALIRATIKSAGPVDPATLPSRVRERIEGRVSGDVDVDELVRQVLAETHKK